MSDNAYTISTQSDVQMIDDQIVFDVVASYSPAADFQMVQRSAFQELGHRLAMNLDVGEFHLQVITSPVYVSDGKSEYHVQAWLRPTAAKEEH